MEDWQPLDGKGAYGNYIREHMIVERHWDRILKLSAENLLNYDNRSKFKCALLGMLYFIKVKTSNKNLLKKMESVMDGQHGSVQDEIKKCYDLMDLLQEILDKTMLAEPKNITWDDKDGESDN